MRGRKLDLIAFITVMAVAACGGDMDGDGDDQPPAAEAPSEQQPQEMAELPEGVTQEMVDEGRTLFSGQAACHACHGPDATGTQLAPDLTDDEWLNISGRNMDEIANNIRTGVPDPLEHPGPMPPMGGVQLTDEQVEALTAYIMTLGPA